ncbi:hypothetical protein AM493_16920 [Flavobacterium akiainvivens]|uniref:TonB C-terminal domain-containing protein n=1 Tax=Flavobacterium akiainvivens TaxID=1202724 RepID=A0A0M9VJB4_9FLAO|nr:hypothetical protein [Flavobacterium akiainvivens]KOS07539.1 hypothetical protein AM493_16920 [Flavobacterium akiainvivens]SFQ64212.1 hypothetical protein SAMN05444144_111112 [Flavobacterium akiainvivens]
MKIKSVLLALLVLVPLMVMAQAAKGETSPEYPGGNQALRQYVASHIRMEQLEVPKHDTLIRCSVSFWVDTLGRMDSFKVLKDPGYGLAYEVVKVLTDNKVKWKPATRNGKPLMANYVLPVMVNLPGSNLPEEKVPAKKD